jgi:hypothetical protein
MGSPSTGIGSVEIPRQSAKKPYHAGGRTELLSFGAH